MQDLVNKKDLAGAKPIIDLINSQELQHAAIGKSDVVNWTSIRQAEGWFPGPPITDQIRLTKEEALGVSNGLIQPTSAGGLMVLLKANYADLVNRMASKDPTAYESMIRVANGYPGVTKEVADEVTTALRWQMRQQTGMDPTTPPMGPSGGATLPAREGTSRGLAVGGRREMVPGPLGEMPKITVPELKPTMAPSPESRRPLPQGPEPEPGSKEDKRNAAAIVKFRKPYRSLSASQKFIIDDQVP